jgi:hypothetical protein
MHALQLLIARQTAVKKRMIDLRRVDLHSPIRAPSSAQTGRKVATWFLAIFIISVMIVWFAFLGWGVVAISQWLLDQIFSLTHF